MTSEGRRRVWVALAVVLSAAFALLAHAAVVRGIPALGAVLSLVPIALLAFVLARRGRTRIALGAIFLAALAGLALGWERVERHFPDLLFLEHAGAHLALGIVFGRTLVGGREPLITRFARIVHGGLPAGVASYTRGVTLAWTLLFATLFAASCGLYFAGQHAAWSFLANILSPLLVLTMFAAEYALRYRMLPDIERVGFVEGARAFARHLQGGALEAPR